MTVLFNDKPCQDPNAAAREGAPIQGANFYSMPAGVYPGQGEILVLEADLGKADFSGAGNTLEFAFDKENVELDELYIVERVRLLSGDEPTAYTLNLLTVADVRHSWGATTIDKRFNYLGPSSVNYYDDSLNAGDTWYWGEMVDWMIKQIPAGTVDQSGFIEPNLSPQNVVFRAGNLADALGWALQVTGHTIQWNDGKWAIVKKTGAANARLLQQAEPRKLFTSHPADAAHHAATFRVYFPDGRYDFQSSLDEEIVSAPDRWHQQPQHYEETATDIAGASADLTEHFWDFLPVLRNDAGAITNQVNLDERRNQLAKAYAEHMSREKLEATYGGLWLFSPGTDIQRVTWRDRGDGYKTDISTDPGPWRTPFLTDAVMRHEQPYYRAFVGTAEENIAVGAIGSFKVQYYLAGWQDTNKAKQVRNVGTAVISTGDRHLCIYSWQPREFIASGGGGGTAPGEDNTAIVRINATAGTCEPVEDDPLCLWPGQKLISDVTGPDMCHNPDFPATVDRDIWVCTINDCPTIGRLDNTENFLAQKIGVYDPDPDGSGTDPRDLYAIFASLSSSDKMLFRFELTSTFDNSTATANITTVEGAPGEDGVTITDIFDHFSRGRIGNKGWCILTATGNYYAITCNQPAIRVRTDLSANLECADGFASTPSAKTIISQPPFDQPIVDFAAAANPFHLAAVAGSTVECAWNAALSQWYVDNVERETIALPVSFQLTAEGLLQYKDREFALMPCGPESDWKELFPTSICDDAGEVVQIYEDDFVRASDPTCTTQGVDVNDGLSPPVWTKRFGGTATIDFCQFHMTNDTIYQVTYQEATPQVIAEVTLESSNVLPRLIFNGEDSGGELSLANYDFLQVTPSDTPGAAILALYRRDAGFETVQDSVTGFTWDGSAVARFELDFVNLLASARIYDDSGTLLASLADVSLTSRGSFVGISHVFAGGVGDESFWRLFGLNRLIAT